MTEPPTPPEEWFPKTREEYVEVFADAFALDRKRQKDAEEAGDPPNDEPPAPAKPRRNFMGGSRTS